MRQPCLLLAAFWLLLCSGCAALRPHSPVRATQAQALDDAWRKAATGSEIAAARVNLQMLLDEQLATADRLAQARREAHINVIAGSGGVARTVGGRVDRLLKNLAGDPATAEAWTTAMQAEAEARRQVAIVQREIGYLGEEAPSCSDIDAGVLPALTAGSAGQVLFVAAIGRLAQACASSELNATAAVTLPPASGIAVLQERVGSARKRIEDERRNSLVLRASYRATLAAYDAAVAAVDPQAQAKSQALLTRLQSLLQQIGKLPDRYSQAFLSEHRKQALDRFFAAASTAQPGAPLPADAGKAAIVFAVLPQQADALRQADADARAAALAGLALQRDYDRIQAEAGERAIAYARRELELCEQLVTLHAELVDRLVQVRGKLAMLERDEPGIGQRSLGALLAERPATPKALARNKGVLEASAVYVDMAFRVDTEIRKTGYRIDFLRRERSLLYAEANVAQWTALIDGGVGQLKAFGDGGIHPEQAVALLNGISLLLIANGVN